MDAQPQVMRLALIEDHELVRAGLARLLETPGPVPMDLVYVGPSVEQALEAGASVALLDVNLGAGAAPVDVNTRMLVEAGVTVLLISAFQDAISLYAGMREGALGFVSKSETYEVLVEALSVVATGELYLTVDLADVLAADVANPDLSGSELSVLRLYASGLKLTAIAHRLGMSVATVRSHLDMVRVKYAAAGANARSRAELYDVASRGGLLTD